MLVCLVAAFLELVVNSYTPETGLMEHYRQASIRKRCGRIAGGSAGTASLSDAWRSRRIHCDR